MAVTDQGGVIIPQCMRGTCYCVAVLWWHILFCSSANAYMLMYRKVDVENNMSK